MPSTSAAATQLRSIGAASLGWPGAGDHEAGDVAQHRHRVVVVEVTAEALLVGEPGDAHDHRVAVRTVREERQARRLAAQLVLGVVQVGEVLDLGDRQQPAHPGAEREPEDRLLVEQGVEHAGCAGLAERGRGSRRTRRPCAPTSSPNTIAFGIDSSTSPSARLIVLGEGERPLLLRQLGAEERPALVVRSRTERA